MLQQGPEGPLWKRLVLTAKSPIEHREDDPG